MVIFARRSAVTATAVGALVAAGVTLAGGATGAPNADEANSLCRQLDDDPTTARLYFELNETSLRMSDTNTNDTLTLAFSTYCPQYAPLNGYLQRIKDVPEAIAEIRLEGNLGATPIYKWTEHNCAPTRLHKEIVAPRRDHSYVVARSCTPRPRQP